MTCYSLRLPTSGVWSLLKGAPPGSPRMDFRGRLRLAHRGPSAGPAVGLLSRTKGFGLPCPDLGNGSVRVIASETMLAVYSSVAIHVPPTHHYHRRNPAGARRITWTLMGRNK